MGLLRRSYIQYLRSMIYVACPSTGFCAEHLLHTAQPLHSVYGLFQNPGLHTGFGLKLDSLKPWFTPKPALYIKRCITQNRVLHKRQGLHKNDVLAWPVQAWFAAG